MVKNAKKITDELVLEGIEYNRLLKTLKEAGYKLEDLEPHNGGDNRAAKTPVAANASFQKQVKKSRSYTPLNTGQNQKTVVHSSKDFNPANILSQVEKKKLLSNLKSDFKLDSQRAAQVFQEESMSVKFSQKSFNLTENESVQNQNLLAGLTSKEEIPSCARKMDPQPQTDSFSSKKTQPKSKSPYRPNPYNVKSGAHHINKIVNDLKKSFREQNSKVDPNILKKSKSISSRTSELKIIADDQVTATDLQRAPARGLDTPSSAVSLQQRRDSQSTQQNVFRPQRNAPSNDWNIDIDNLEYMPEVFG